MSPCLSPVNHAVNMRRCRYEETRAIRGLGCWGLEGQDGTGLRGIGDVGLKVHGDWGE